MKKFDLVKLINLTEIYKNNNLYLNAKGIILKINRDMSNVLFFNDYNQGDYAYLEINNNDLEILSNSATFTNYTKQNFENFNPKRKGFKSKDFEAYQEVELLIEDDKYSKFGIHKGDKGTIMESFAVKDYVLVDFGRLDENNNYIGDCISVKLKDLKIINTKKD